jgi:aminoacrylate hydrolase
MHHEIHGRTDRDAPTVLLSSGLGGAAHYWTPQIPALAKDFRVIAYDQTGTGRSPGPLPDGYSIADMAAEAAALLDRLGIEKAHFIGHALGGLIGLQLAVDRPALVDRLILVNAWAKTHPHTLRCFAARKSLLLNTGPAAYVQAQPLFLYPAAWLADRQDPGRRGVRPDRGHSHHHGVHPGHRHAGRRSGALHLFDRARGSIATGSAGTARPGWSRLQHHRSGRIRYDCDGLSAGLMPNGAAGSLPRLRLTDQSASAATSCMFSATGWNSAYFAQ